MRDSGSDSVRMNLLTYLLTYTELQKYGFTDPTRGYRLLCLWICRLYRAPYTPRQRLSHVPLAYGGHTRLLAR